MDSNLGLYVKTMLEFLTGRATPVKDLFRIGRFKKPASGQPTSDQPTPARPRPLVLKLASPWDRRLVLTNRFHLKNYEVKGLFVHEDLSPEDRQLRREKFAARRPLPSPVLPACGSAASDSVVEPAP